MRPIVLLTDFGHDDHYVGVLHAVTLRDAPGVQRIDLVHTVPPGDVWTACYVLRSAVAFLPAEAVVLVVVDPGVGTERRALAAQIEDRWLVGPDNGLLCTLGEPQRVVELDWRRMGLSTPSATFHGRDLFAPAAARLARGDDADSIGELVDRVVQPCPLPEPEIDSFRIRGCIQHIDRFGNAVTTVRGEAVADGAEVRSGWHRIRRRVRTYGEAGHGEAVFLEGSSGFIEIALCNQSAARVLGLSLRDAVEITIPDTG